MIKRKTISLRGGEIIDVQEYHDGNYGAPKKRRGKRVKPTREEVQAVNERNRMKRCRLRLLEYFRPGDCLATWTYAPENRPPDMRAAIIDFQKAIRKVRAAYRKRGNELFWIRNIEQGTKGAWHIHLVVNEIGDTASILSKAWKKGGTWITKVKTGKDGDFTELASYLVKNQNTRYQKKDGETGKPRIRAANYGTSKNMPLPEAKVSYLERWKKEAKPKKGYYIARIQEGINPITGYLYRSYTMIRLGGGEEGVDRRYLHHNRRKKPGGGKKKVRIRTGMPPGTRKH